MNFLEVTIYDIFLVSRGEELKQLVKSIDTLQEYNQINDSDSEGMAVDLMLENKPLTLDDVEEFAYENDLIHDNECLAAQYDGNPKWGSFDNHKRIEFKAGNIHQLQYENYKYVGKHA